MERHKPCHTRCIEENAMFIFAPTVGVQSVLSLVYELDAAQDAQFSEMLLAEALLENQDDVMNQPGDTMTATVFESFDDMIDAMYGNKS